MRLMAPGVGWAAADEQLFWTTDDGKNWKDITPPTTPGTEISSAFFLDTSTGWALLTRGSDQKREFDFAATTNAGGTWTVTRLQVPNPDPETGLDPAAWIDFADASHGWIDVRVPRGSGPPHSFGVLLTTEDGGKTWKPLQQPPAANAMLFHTPQDGWLAEDGDLFRTRDGGKTWQQVSLNAPPAVLSAKQAHYYDLPVFQDAKRGSLLVVTAALDSSGIAVDGSGGAVLLSTVDGGNRWTVGQVLPSEFGGQKVTLIDGTALAAEISPSHLLTLTKAGAVNSSVRTDLTSIANNVAVVTALSVLEDNRIWLLGMSNTNECGSLYPRCSEILSSSDGGVSWSKITPVTVKPRSTVAQESGVASPYQALPPSMYRSSAPTFSPSTFAPTTTVSVHLGFDISRVICLPSPPACTPTRSVSAMQTWWNKSAYFDTSLYLPGSANRSKDPNLNATWVSSVQGQGWGLIPIWFGLQPPCVITKTGLTSFISLNTTTANSQGKSEADSAASAAQSMGVAGTIVYKDIENYDTTNSTCRAAVRAFLNGWSAEIRTKGYSRTGAYGNPAPASLDFTQVSPPLDDAWIARYDTPPRVTVWGLDPTLSDSLWPANQRIHQYRKNFADSYGVVSATIDNDIEDATLVTPATSKVYSHYSVSTSPIIYPGAANTTPYGVNNSDEIVGSYYTCDVSCNPDQAFKLVGSSYGTLNLNGSYNFAIGVNNAGVIVGCYNNCSNGFIDSAAGVVTTINFPGGLTTAASGINDDNQIAGYWTDSTTQHGFIYTGWPACNPCTWTSIDVSGAVATILRAINGDGQATGYWADANGDWSPFTYSISTGAYNLIGEAPGSTTTQVFTINDNGQIMGLGMGLGNPYGMFVYDENSQSFARLPHDSSDVPGTPYGANDQGQIVGSNDFISGAGFLTTPITP